MESWIRPQGIEEAAADAFRRLMPYEQALELRRDVSAAVNPSSALVNRVSAAVTARPAGYGTYVFPANGHNAAAGPPCVVPRPPAVPWDHLEHNL